MWSYTAMSATVINLTTVYGIVQSSQVSTRITVNGVIFDKQQMSYSLDQTTREFSLHLLKALEAKDEIQFDIFISSAYSNLNFTIASNV